jgi:uncharacterized protein (TIGR02246 family)
MGSACVCALILARAPAADNVDEVAAVRKAIAAQNVKYAKAVSEMDVPSYLSLYTDDATLLYSGKAVKGRTARENAAKSQLAATTDPTFKQLEVDVRGDLAYEVGEYTVMPRAGGNRMKGTYLVVWKRQQDGEWKIHVEASTGP